MARIDNRFIKWMALGAGVITRANTEEEAVSNLRSACGGRLPAEYDVYYMVSKEGESLTAMVDDGLMYWSPGASRTLVTKVRAGVKCYLGEA